MRGTTKMGKIIKLQCHLTLSIPVENAKRYLYEIGGMWWYVSMNNYDPFGAIDELPYPLA